MFLAFPLNNKPDWRNPPWLTILLILINCIVYFGWQRPEEAVWEKAADYYFESDLPDLELPRYVEYLKRSNDAHDRKVADYIDRAASHGHREVGLEYLEQDRRFLAELHGDRIVRPDEEEYPTWREQRAHFEQMKPPPFTSRWASNPSDWKPVTLITATFLHGSVSHLVGNMIFLFAFGYTVELALGRGRYLLFYLLAGCAGEVGDLLARWDSSEFGLGASGAISGLMAMYAMLYGRQRIRFFYQLLFYFDYVKAPAIILLPVWIGHEFLQQWLNPDGGIAYMAHAGGLIGGTLLLAWHKHFHPQTVVPPTDEPVDDGFDEMRRKAEHLVKAMKLDEARAAYGRLVDLRPTNRDALLKYFNLAKLAPASEDFHRAAHRILSLEVNDPPTAQLLHESFQTYWSAAKPRPRLSANQMARLAVRFAHGGQLADAERLAKLLLAQAPRHEALPSVLLGLVRAELRRNARERAMEHGRTLSTHFGDSAEARIATELIA